MIHREGRDFDVLMESFDAGETAHTVLGRRGAGIEAGHVIVSLYEGAPERWRVRSISRGDGGTWCASVVPAPALQLVA